MTFDQAPPANAVACCVLFTYIYSWLHYSDLSPAQSQSSSPFKDACCVRRLKSRSALRIAKWLASFWLPSTNQPQKGTRKKGKKHVKSKGEPQFLVGSSSFMTCLYLICLSTPRSERPSISFSVARNSGGNTELTAELL